MFPVHVPGNRQVLAIPACPMFHEDLDLQACRDNPSNLRDLPAICRGVPEVPVVPEILRHRAILALPSHHPSLRKIISNIRKHFEGFLLVIIYKSGLNQ